MSLKNIANKIDSTKMNYWVNITNIFTIIFKIKRMLIKKLALISQLFSFMYYAT